MSSSHAAILLPLLLGLAAGVCLPALVWIVRRLLRLQ